MRLACLLAFVIVLGAALPASARTARTNEFVRVFVPDLYNLNDEDVKAAIRAQVGRISGAIESSRPLDRASRLRSLAKATRWGSPERSVTYLACAWYGVDYTRSRDYLLNTAFWVERGYHGLGRPDPFCWYEDTFDFLYRLYEHNHDYQLLSQLLTGHSDGAGATYLNDIRTLSFDMHPRGVLHVAALSRSGLYLAAGALVPHGPFGPDTSKFGRKDGGFLSVGSRAQAESGKRVFAIYVDRVAADPKDPLQETAQSVRRLARRVDRWNHSGRDIPAHSSSSTTRAHAQR